MNGLYRIRPGGIFRGNIHKNGVGGIIALMQKDSILRIEGNGRGIRVSSSEGNLWITQENDRKDYFVTEGETFTLDRSGLVIVYALSDANIEMARA